MYQKATNLKIVRLVMQETGTYNPQFSRPYVTHFEPTTLNAITERVIEQGNGRFDSAALAGLSSSFISPSAAPESLISIASGWNEKRVRFLMEIECQYIVGGAATTYIQGYTSFPGVSANQAVAPDMEFYINSIVTTKKSFIPTPFGMQTVATVTDNSHLLCSNSWQGLTQPGQQRMMRPQDVFCNMQSSHIQGVYDNDISNVFDGRTILRTEATKSARGNGLAGSYASKIIDGYVIGSSLSDFGQSETAILNRGKSEVMEAQASIDPFLAALASITANGITNRFKYSDLVKLDSNVSYVSNFAISGQTQQIQNHSVGQTSGWHGSDNVTLGATILSQAVPAIMMDLMITRLIFKSTNHDITGQMQTIIIDGKSFSNMDLTRHFDLFKRRLEKEVLLDLTFNNQIGYSIDMRVDLLGETWISISLDGKAAVDYVTPSFCDNLFVPVITSNANTVQNLTNDFENLVTNVKEAMGSSSGGILISNNV